MLLEMGSGDQERKILKDLLDTLPFYDTSKVSTVE